MKDVQVEVMNCKRLLYEEEGQDVMEKSIAFSESMGGLQQRIEFAEKEESKEAEPIPEADFEELCPDLYNNPICDDIRASESSLIGLNFQVTVLPNNPKNNLLFPLLKPKHKLMTRKFIPLLKLFQHETYFLSNLQDQLKARIEAGAAKQRHLADGFVDKEKLILLGKTVDELLKQATFVKDTIKNIQMENSKDNLKPEGESEEDEDEKFFK